MVPWARRIRNPRHENLCIPVDNPSVNPGLHCADHSIDQIRNLRLAIQIANEWEGAEHGGEEAS
jgi:hypothetical protein